MDTNKGPISQAIHQRIDSAGGNSGIGRAGDTQTASAIMKKPVVSRPA